MKKGRPFIGIETGQTMTENEKNNQELSEKDINNEKDNSTSVTHLSEETSASVEENFPKEKLSGVHTALSSEIVQVAPAHEDTGSEQEPGTDESFVFVDSDAPEEPNALERLTETIINDWQKRMTEKNAEQHKEEAHETVDIPANFEIVTPKGNASESEQEK